MYYHGMWCFLMQNSFPMTEWHIEHMEKLVIKFVTGLSENATNWEKKQNKRYNKISIVCRQIEYDIKHGVTVQQVLMHIQKIRTHSSFLNLLKKEGSSNRLDQLKEHFAPSVERYTWRWHYLIAPFSRRFSIGTVIFGSEAAFPIFPWRAWSESRFFALSSSSSSHSTVLADPSFIDFESVTFSFIYL